MRDAPEHSYLCNVTLFHVTPHLEGFDNPQALNLAKTVSIKEYQRKGFLGEEFRLLSNLLPN